MPSFQSQFFLIFLYFIVSYQQEVEEIFTMGDVVKINYLNISPTGAVSLLGSEQREYLTSDSYKNNIIWNSLLVKPYTFFPSKY